MIPLLLLLSTADATPLRKATREPSVRVVDASAGARVGDLRAVDGKGVLVVIERDGALVRFEGDVPWERVGRVAAGAVDDVAVDGAGDVHVLGGGAVRRWVGDALEPVPLPEGAVPLDLRPAAHAAVASEATATLPLGVGLVVDLDRPAEGAAPPVRLVEEDGGWTLEGAGESLPLAAGHLVDALAWQGGWAVLVDDELRLSSAAPGQHGRVPHLSPGPGAEQVALRAVEGGVMAVAWDRALLRASTLRSDALTPLRHDARWMPAGPPVDWPRAARADDPLPVTSRLDVPLPTDFRLAAVAVLPRHLLAAGTMPTAAGRAPVVLVVERIPEG